MVDINIRKDSQIFMAQIPRIRQSDGLEIYPSICFKCMSVTEFAADPTNESGKAIDGIEFFESSKCTEIMLKEMKNYALQNNLTNAIEKLNNVKY